MNLVRRSERVPYPAAQMYELVNNVELYPDFLHWCRSVEVHEAGDRLMVATLELVAAGLHKRVTTRNRLVPGREIEMQLVRGPFRHFSGRWRFIDDPPGPGAGGSHVSLELDFDLSSRLLRLTAGPMLRHLADGMVAAFRDRANACYAAGG